VGKKKTRAKYLSLEGYGWLFTCKESDQTRSIVNFKGTRTYA
jgi:hypothetical protein